MSKQRRELAIVRSASSSLSYFHPHLGRGQLLRASIMATKRMLLPALVTVFYITLLPHSSCVRNTYIVHMSKPEMPTTTTHSLDWYVSTVRSVTSSYSLKSHDDDVAVDDPSSRILYSYDTAFHGFAALLSADEAELMQSVQGVVAVHPDTVCHLHTTRSPGFLGLDTVAMNSMWAAGVADHGVIVGVLDTGVWPEHASFNDHGMGPVPARWKGACEEGREFTKQHCNRKIVGARMFYRGYEASAGTIDERAEYKSPRDQDGHGTHTAATAVGSPAEGANLLGYATGTARGMASQARLAVYKVCWTGGCFSSDILSAVDRAVADGVDVLSISLGGGVTSYSRDSLSLAAFGAMEMGVFVASSAGNGGPDPVSLTNVAPWVTTVGAGTVDRDFPAFVRLGDGRNVSGVSVYSGRRNLSVSTQYPLIYLGGNSTTPDPRSLCLEGTLDPHLVAGRIVLCDRGINPRVQKGEVVKKAGGVGMILGNTVANGDELVADSHLLPTVAVGHTVGKAIRSYASTNPRPTATLSFGGTKLGIRPSPVVAAFSSRGPNVLSLEILKPDVVAPGVNILAAWSGAAGPSSLSYDHRRVGFNIISGTSMSCPHVAGVAALIKSVHPDWSPSAIKSALMTTAYVHDNTFAPLRDAATGAPSTYYAHGAGHINPSKALDPGLVYDSGPQDYYDFLCTQRLTALQLKAFSKTTNRTCRNAFASPGDLNYPAISAVFPEQPSSSTLTLRRVATNVGPPSSTYHVKVTPFKGATVVVEPEVLRFTSKYQKMAYKVSFITKVRQPRPEFGALAWKDGVHSVRCPIVITWLAAL